MADEKEDFLRNASEQLVRKSPAGIVLDTMHKAGEKVEDAYEAGRRWVRQHIAKPKPKVKRTTDIALPSPKRRSGRRTAR